MSNVPIYEPATWNSDKYIRWSHNCYAYALNTVEPELGTLCKRRMRQLRRRFGKIHPCKKIFPQPGNYANYEWDRTIPQFSCKNVVAGMLADNPGILNLGTVDTECPDGYYKIALACNAEGDDYHFWRQDADGTWSHKNGRTRAQQIDNPKNNLGKYIEFCGFFAVPIASHRHMSSS